MCKVIGIPEYATFNIKKTTDNVAYFLTFNDKIEYTLK